MSRRGYTSRDELPYHSLPSSWSSWDTLQAVTNVVSTVAQTAIKANSINDKMEASRQVQQDVSTIENASYEHESDRAAAFKDYQSSLLSGDYSQAYVATAESILSAPMYRADRQAASQNKQIFLQTVQKNGASLLYDTSINKDDGSLSEHINAMADLFSHQATTKEIGVALRVGAQQTAAKELEKEATFGDIASFNAKDKQLKAFLDKFNVVELDRSRSKSDQALLNNVNNLYSNTYKAGIKSITAQNEAKFEELLATPSMYMDGDRTVRNEIIPNISTNPSVRATKLDKWDKAVTSARLINKYNDLTTTIPPEAWSDAGFKEATDTSIVGQITGPTNPEYKVSVINAQSGHLSKVSKYYEELSASNPSVAYDEYLKLSRVPGGEQAAYKLFKKDTLNNLKDISILQRVVTNTEGTNISTREAQDALAKGYNDPFTPTSESKKARDEYFTQINNSAIPTSLKRDAQTSMDKLYASTGNPLVYKTVYNEYVDKATEEVSDITVYKATAGIVNERMVDKFKQDLSGYGTYDSGWFEDNTYIEGDGSGGITMYEKDSLGIVPDTPIAKLSSVEVTNLSGDTERQKKVTAAKNNIISTLGKIPTLATTIVRQAYDNTFSNGEGAIQDVLDATEPKQEELQTSLDFLGDYLQDASDVLIDYFANMNSKEDTNATK